MSLFCHGVLLGVESESIQKECKTTLQKFAKDYCIGIQFNDFYEEPVISKYYRHIPYFIWNFSDNASTENCEHLLCPDWCNIEPSRPLLVSRLAILKDILVSVSSFGKLEVWIGTSGDEVCDMEHIKCNFQSFVSVVIDAYCKGIGTPSIHVEII